MSVEQDFIPFSRPSRKRTEKHRGCDIEMQASGDGAYSHRCHNLLQQTLSMPESLLSGRRASTTGGLAERSRRNRSRSPRNSDACWYRKRRSFSNAFQCTGQARRHEGFSQATGTGFRLRIASKAVIPLPLLHCTLKVLLTAIYCDGCRSRPT